MRYAEINEATITYDVSGAGTSIVFLHGLLARGTGEYYFEFKRLLSRSNQVYALDMRGHGGSAAVGENVTLEQYARDVAAFVDLLHLDNAVLVGHSMGGLVSLAAAILNPQRFRALAVLTPAACKGLATSDAQVSAFMAARRDRRLMDQNFAGMFTKPPKPAVIDVLREAALLLPDSVVERWVRSELPNSDLTSALGSLRLPVLSLIGGSDVVVPPQRQYEDAMGLPDAKVVTFTDEGHMLPLENPERCADEVLRFLQDQA